jgi:hypothetical protein
VDITIRSAKAITRFGQETRVVATDEPTAWSSEPVIRCLGLPDVAADLQPSVQSRTGNRLLRWLARFARGDG